MYELQGPPPEPLLLKFAEVPPGICGQNPESPKATEQVNYRDSCTEAWGRKHFQRTIGFPGRGYTVGKGQGVGAGRVDTVPGPLLRSMNLAGSLGTLCAMGDAQAPKGLKEV